jgi:hypothetical protein
LILHSDGILVTIACASEVFRSKPRIFPNPGKRGWADFFAVMETECEVGPTGTLQLSVRTNLLLERPPEP